MHMDSRPLPDTTYMALVHDAHAKRVANINEKEGVEDAIEDESWYRLVHAALCVRGVLVVVCWCGRERGGGRKAEEEKE